MTQRLERTKTSAPEIRRLYSLCFPLLRGLPTKLKIKPALRSFSGLTRDEQRVSARGKIRRMLKEEKVPVIGRLLLLMDIDFEEGKEREKEMVDRVMQWLDSPQPTGRELQSIPTRFMDRRATGSKKRKRRSSAGGTTGSKKKKKSDGGSESSGSDSGDSSGSGSGSDSSDDSSPSRKASSSSKPKKAKSSAAGGGGGGGGRRKRSDGKASLRTTNSFVVFSSAKRDELRQLHPELSVQGVTSQLAQMWRDLMPEEKEVYELAAKRLREDAAREEKEAKRSGNAASKKRKSSKKPTASKKEAASAKKKPERKAESASSSDSASSGSSSGSDSGTEDEDEAMEAQEAASAAQSTSTSTTASPRGDSVKVEAVDANGNEEKEDVNAAIKEEEERVKREERTNGEGHSEAKAESS